MTARKAPAAAPGRSIWRDRAACRDADPDLFFPDRVGTDISAAQGICAGCPDRAECHGFAEETNQVYGVWAGVDRGSLRARRTASAA